MRTLLVCIVAIGLFACAKPFNYYEDINSVVQIKEIIMGSHGTGFYIGDGYIVTAKHVVPLDIEYYYVDKNDDTLHNLEVVFRSETIDFAVVRTRHKHTLTPVVFAEKPARVGDFVHSIGFPVIMKWTYSCGYVTGTNISFELKYDERIKTEFAQDLMSTNIPIDRGMSGGPIFNQNSEVVGMVNAMLSSGSFGWGLSLDAIKQGMKEWRDE